MTVSNLLGKDKVLIINGYDFTPLIEKDGLTYKRNDVDGPDAGELADGTIRRSRVIVRPSMDVQLIGRGKKPIRDELAHAIMKALEPQWLKVTYFDVRMNKEVTRDFYTNGVGYKLESYNGARRWIFDTFTLVARGVAGDGRENLG